MYVCVVWGGGGGGGGGGRGCGGVLQHNILTGTIIVQSIFTLGSTFQENMASKASADHVSALVSFRFPIHLGGFNHFISNKGGGISLLNSQMTVAGELLMDSNSATYGGGMSLDDICLVCGIHIFINCNIDTHVCCIELEAREISLETTFVNWRENGISRRKLSWIALSYYLTVRRAF